MMSGYTEDSNPYKLWHMRRAFRMGWEAAEDGLDCEQARLQVAAADLNRMTTPAWWRGFRTQRGER
jgi:hypothetical protein